MSSETGMSVEGHFAQLITKTGEEAIESEVSLPRAFAMSDLRAFPHVPRAGRALDTEGMMENSWISPKDRRQFFEPSKF